MGAWFLGACRHLECIITIMITVWANPKPKGHRAYTQSVYRCFMVDSRECMHSTAEGACSV